MRAHGFKFFICVCDILFAGVTFLVGKTTYFYLWGWQNLFVCVWHFLLAARFRFVYVRVHFLILQFVFFYLEVYFLFICVYFFYLQGVPCEPPYVSDRKSRALIFC